MIPVLIVVAVIVVAAVLWMMRKPARPAPAERQSLPRSPAGGTADGDVRKKTAAPADAAVAAARVAQAAPVTAVPATADDPRLIHAETLTDERRQQLLNALRSIPKPPTSLHKLVSPDFLARASSSELSELVLSEPVVAAKVMVAVNSPMYGLHQTVTNVGQGITFLGLNTVRSLCLQYLLSETLSTKDAQLRQEFDTLWHASAIASEMCLHLAKRLQLTDAPGMATMLVLSSLGRFAVATLMRRAGDATDLALAGRSLIQRALAEQATLSLSASEIGYLLMQEWGLPDTMVRATGGIGRILFTGAPAADTERATRLALCALCASLAERIARGQLTDLFAYDLSADDGEDQQVLRAHLPPTLLAQVAEALRSPEMARVLA